MKKKKNDFTDEPSYHVDSEIIRPAACLYCQRTDLMPVRQRNGKSNNRVYASHATDSAFTDAFTSAVHSFYPMAGWRCRYCGFVMWFTPPDIYVDDEG